MAEAQQGGGQSGGHGADVVVVGGGVAGGLVAHDLAAAGISVILLEAGDWMDRWILVERFRSDPVKDLMSPYIGERHAPHPSGTPGQAKDRYLIQKGPHPYNTQYIRAVGGTTWHWAAACWRYLPVDFRLKSEYGVGRDWPISYDDLEPYYDRAEVELGVAGPDDEELGSPRSRDYPMKALPLSYMDRNFMRRLNDNGWFVATEPVARNSGPYDGRPACCGNNNCMPICPIAAQYSGDVHVRKAQAAGAQVIVNAIAHRIEADDDGRVTGVTYRNRLDGSDTTVGCRQLVLAANGIEIPKLMLMSASEKRPGGVGNSSGLVGRNLMDHPGTGVTFMADTKLWPGRGPQEMTSVLNLRDGPFRSEYAAKKLHLSNSVQVGSVTERMIENGELEGDILARIADRSARQLAIHSFHEQLPDPANRIRPSADETDETGLPKPELHYAIGEYVRRSAEKTHEAYARIAELMGATEVWFDDSFFNNNHLMGTTIMGASPRDSVVDGECRSHDHPNLYVASSSVNATSATVNPTLTIAALSLRIADSVKRALKG